MKLTQALVTFVASVSLLAAGCGKEDKKAKEKEAEKSTTAEAATDAGDASGRRPFAGHPIQLLAGMPGLEAQQPSIRPELALLFCEHVYRLPHKADFAQELDQLCDADRKPSKVMADLDRYAKIVGTKPASVQLGLEHGAEYSTGIFAAVYDIPILPKWVRSGQIQAYMMRPSKFADVTLDGLVTQDLNNTVGGDLQFSRYTLNYKTDVDTPDKKPFFSERNTEFNAYQVQGGNPDIGIGTEHLSDTANGDFQYFHTITVTIGNTNGGSVMITVIKAVARHNGYQDLTAKVFSDTATAQAQNVHDGLMSELAGYVTKP